MQLQRNAVRTQNSFIRLYRQTPGFEVLPKKRAPSGVEAAIECELRMPCPASVKPGRGVAETLAAVFAPAAAASAHIVGRELFFAQFRRPSQFAPCARAPLFRQQIPERAPEAIPGAQPDEVKQLMYEHAGKFRARAIERDPALPQKGGGVRRAVAVAKSTDGGQGYGFAREGRQASTCRNLRRENSSSSSKRRDWRL